MCSSAVLLRGELVSSSGCIHLSSADSSSVQCDVAQHTHSAAACHFCHLVVSVAPQGVPLRI